MVLPLAALDTGGSYCFFLSLFIYATLFFLAPHHVKSAQPLAAWIDRSKPFAPTSGNSTFSASLACAMIGPLTMVFQSLPQRDVTCITLRTIATTSVRRAWDPGIDLPASHSNVVVVTMVRTNRPTSPFNPMGLHSRRATRMPLAIQICDPGIASSVSVFHGVHPVLSDGQDDASNECRGALALIQSLFQYSHPILSRPTVPNIR